jgi:hypothetical protein
MFDKLQPCQHGLAAVMAIGGWIFNEDGWCRFFARANCERRPVPKLQFAFAIIVKKFKQSGIDCANVRSPPVLVSACFTLLD